MEPTDEDPALKKLKKNFTDPFKPMRMYKIQEKLRGADEAWNRIFWFADASDIVEVFWHNSNRVDVSVSASSDYRFLPSPYPPLGFPHLFSSIGIFPTPVYFNNRSILFISPMMGTDDITQFISDIDPTERDRIRRIAINHHIFEALDKSLLAQFSGLRNLILVSEITTTEDTTQLGPLADPPQQVFFHLIPSTELRSEVPYDANDLRMETQGTLILIEQKHDVWATAPVMVDVAWIERDGKLMKTDFPSDSYLDLRAKQIAKAEAISKERKEEQERQEASDYVGNPPSDGSADGVAEKVDQIGSVGIGNPSLVAFGNGGGDPGASQGQEDGLDEDTRRQVAEMDRQHEVLEKQEFTRALEEDWDEGDDGNEENYESSEDGESGANDSGQGENNTPEGPN